MSKSKKNEDHSASEKNNIMKTQPVNVQSLITQVNEEDVAKLNLKKPSHTQRKAISTSNKVSPLPLPLATVEIPSPVTFSPDSSPKKETHKKLGCFRKFLLTFFCCLKSKSPTKKSRTSNVFHNLKYFVRSKRKKVPSHGRAVSTATTHHPRSRRMTSRVLLPPVLPQDTKKKCLVLDMDETLIHSSFKPVNSAHFTIKINLEGMNHTVYVLKRPGVDEFLEAVSSVFEVVIFTASLANYANPLMDILDRRRVVRHRLFREGCVQHKGTYVKDLSMLGRDLASIIILDNSPASYLFHPSNAIPISTWLNDPTDRELLELLPFLMDLQYVDDVREVLDNTGD